MQHNFADFLKFSCFLNEVSTKFQIRLKPRRSPSRSFSGRLKYSVKDPWKKHLNFMFSYSKSYCWWFRNPAITSWGIGSLSHYLQRFSTIQGGWEWDFWTINRYVKIYSPKVLKSWPLGWVSFFVFTFLFATSEFWHNSHRAQNSAVASPSVLQRGSKSNSVLEKSEPQFVSPDFSCHQKVLRVELTTSKKEHLLPMRKLYEIRAFFSVSLVFNWGHPNSEIRTW